MLNKNLKITRIRFQNLNDLSGFKIDKSSRNMNGVLKRPCKTTIGVSFNFVTETGNISKLVFASSNENILHYDKVENLLNNMLSCKKLFLEE